MGWQKLMTQDKQSTSGPLKPYPIRAIYNNIIGRHWKRIPLKEVLGQSLMLVTLFFFWVNDAGYAF